MLRFWVGIGVDSKAYTKCGCGAIMGYQLWDIDQTSASNGKYSYREHLGDLNLTPHIDKTKKGNPVGLPFVAIVCYSLTSSRGMSKYPSSCHNAKNCSNWSISGKVMSIFCSMIKFLLGLMVA